MMQQAAHTLSLETILSITEDAMQQLLQVLKNETTILAEKNLDALERITFEKIILTEQIEKNEQQRVHFLTGKSFNPNEPKQWLQNNKSISIWNEIKILSEQCQKQNQINGLVINGNRRRVQTQIDILTSSSPTVELVYSASGESVKQSDSSTLAHA